MPTAWGGGWYGFDGLLVLQMYGVGLSTLRHQWRTYGARVSLLGHEGGERRLSNGTHGPERFAQSLSLSVSQSPLGVCLCLENAMRSLASSKRACLASLLSNHLVPV